MKALLYKEFKLAMHPICYVFIILFPFMILIPSYPLAVGSIYVLTCYPILFLGANKGQQSNDLLYSALLPVRKKDIVAARIITVAVMHAVFMGITSLLFPLARYINSVIPAPEGVGATIPGLGLDAYVLILAITLIGYSLSDLIFFPIYYKKGKSIVMSTLLMILGFIIYISLFTVALPYVPALEGLINTLTDALWLQFIILAVALVIYAVIHFVIYKVSAKLLEKVDF